MPPAIAIESGSKRVGDKFEDARLNRGATGIAVWRRKIQRARAGLHSAPPPLKTLEKVSEFPPVSIVGAAAGKPNRNARGRGRRGSQRAAGKVEFPGARTGRQTSRAQQTAHEIVGPAAAAVISKRDAPDVRSTALRE